MRKPVIKKTIMWLTVLALLVSLPLTARAAGGGTLRVYMHSVEDKAVIPGATLELYKVAEYSGEDIELTEGFADSGITLTKLTDALTESAEELDGYVATAQPEPVSTGVTGEDGYAVFEGMDDGVYYVRYDPTAKSEEAYSRTVSMRSFIVALPTLDEGEWLRDLTCRPKCELTTLTDVSVTKVWKDDGTGGRPESVQVTLYNGSEKLETVTLSGKNGWTHVWEGLSEAGEYSVKEENVPAGYTCVVTEPDRGVFVVTNTKTPTPVKPPNEPKTPKTGDEANMQLWLTVMAAGMFLCAAVVSGSLHRKKR